MHLETPGDAREDGKLVEHVRNESLREEGYGLRLSREKLMLLADSPTGAKFRSLRFRDAVCNYSPPEFEDDSSSTSSSTTLLPEAPDGGYAWVIVIASFLIHFICDGISFSYGIIFPQIQENFDVSATMSGIVGSIFLSIPLLSGPVAGVLTDVYDCRRMTIVGGIIAAAGAFISFFVFDIWQFVFTFGFIIGIGLSFCYNTAIVAVTYYFQKKRALATGIAVCGSGAGTAVFAPFLEMLFAKFGWRVTLIFLGVLLLLLVGCGLMMKDLEWPQDTIEYKRRKFIEQSERAKLNNLIEAEQENAAANVEVVYGDVALRHAISLPLMPTFTEWCLQKTDTSISKHSIVQRDEAVSRCRSDGAFLRLPPEKSKEPKSPIVSALSPRTPKPTEAVDVPGDAALVTSRSMAEFESAPVEPSVVKDSDRALKEGAGDWKTMNGKQPGGKTLDVELTDVAPKKKEKEKPAIVVSVVEDKQGDGVKRQPSNTAQKPEKFSFKAFPPLTVDENRVLTIPATFGAAQGRVPASNVISFGWRYYGFNNLSRRAPSAPVIFFRRKRKSRVLRVAKMLESCGEWFSVVKSLLIVPSFAVFLLSTFMLYIFFDIPYVNFPEHATQRLNVTDTHASYLVTTIGIFNTISMLVCGLLADWKIMKKYLMQLYGSFIVIAGICVFSAPFVTNYYVLMVLCAGFGFFISANYVLASVITVHLLCLYDFQTGYGLLCLIEGLGNLVGPGLVGYLRDTQSSYHYIFVYGGIGTILSGLMVIGIEVITRFTKEHDDTTSLHSTRSDQPKKLDGELIVPLQNGICKN